MHTKPTNSFCLKFITLSVGATMALACSTDDDAAEVATFGGETEAQQQLLVQLSDGSLPAVGVLFALAFSDPENECPSVSSSGDSITVTGGCTDDEGTTFGGSIELTNYNPDIFGDPPNPDAGSEVRYNRFTLSQAGNEILFDGTIKAGPDIEGQDIEVSIDFLVDFDGTDIMSSMPIDDFMRFTGDLLCIEAVCTFQENATGELGSLGTFGISGSYGSGSQVIYEGTNTMTITPEVDGGECTALSVENAEVGRVCPEEQSGS